MADDRKHLFKMTVSPSPFGGELLSVSDAMSQMLDMMRALEESITDNESVVWKLEKAHTNSPPFTVLARPVSTDPKDDIGPLPMKAAERFVSDMKLMAAGKTPSQGYGLISAPLRKALFRNTQNVHSTAIGVGNGEYWKLDSAGAKKALKVIDLMDAQFALDNAETDWSRQEFGSIEGKIRGLTYYYGSKALSVKERLSGLEITVALTDDLAERIGTEHTWREAWESVRVTILGEIFYKASGEVARANAFDIEVVDARSVPLNELRGVDILGDLTVKNHLEILRGEDDE